MQVQLLQVLQQSAARTLSPRGESRGQQTTLENAPTPDVLYVLLGASLLRFVSFPYLIAASFTDACVLLSLIKNVHFYLVCRGILSAAQPCKN